MAYLALYRKFRPTTLDDVVRQEHIVTVLKNQIETGRISHAYLFCGPRGTGKTSIAKIFAAAINCERPVHGSPCGKCAACKALSDPANLDISEIDAASNNGVDEMRDLREKVQYPPAFGKYKVYIIDEAHMLSQGAFNALLKTLEEPPSHAVFILATTESQKIPATILSRCMRFDFKLIPLADLERRLKKILNEIGVKYEETAVSAIARAGNGSVRDMLSIADTCVSYSPEKLTYQGVVAVLGSAQFDVTASLCKSILTGDGNAAFEQTEEILSSGKGVGVLVKDVMNFLNAVAVAKNCRNAAEILSMPEETFALVQAAADAAGGHTLLRATEIFAKTETDLRYSASPRIVFETAVLKASMPEADYGAEALISRIEHLERAIAHGGFAAEAIPEPPKKAEKPMPAPEEKEEFPPMDFEEAPPDEAVTGGNVYFDAPPVQAPPPKPKPAPAPAPVPSASGDAKMTFGKFLRTLRRTAKNGVLFTLCMDLDYAFEEGKFVMYTEVETIHNSLHKPDHYSLIAEALQAVGVTEFEIRLRGSKNDEFQKSLEELKKTFSDTKIELK